MRPAGGARLFAAAMLMATAAGPAFAADPVPAGADRVSVRIPRPEAFTDFKATCVGMDERTRGLLTDLTRFIRATGARYVADGGALEVTLTDVDMAGEFETWRGPQACSVRVMLDIYAPRIRLEYRLVDHEGKVVSAGRRELRDPLYLTRAVLLATDPLRYEKNLLLDWFQREFAGRTGGVSGSGGATKRRRCESSTCAPVSRPPSPWRCSRTSTGVDGFPSTCR
ncbi:MAG: DUF3016 domain-containing protein [Candidatus Rokuibacteriota bacterium]